MRLQYGPNQTGPGRPRCPRRPSRCWRSAQRSYCGRNCVLPGWTGQVRSGRGSHQGRQQRPRSAFQLEPVLVLPRPAGAQADPAQRKTPCWQSPPRMARRTPCPGSSPKVVPSVKRALRRVHGRPRRRGPRPLCDHRTKRRSRLQHRPTRLPARRRSSSPARAGTRTLFSESRLRSSARGSSKRFPTRPSLRI